MSKLGWYWHRLRAMGPVEMALHARKKLRQFSDARGHPDWHRWELQSTGAFPSLPDPAKAPEALRAGLKRDVEDILAGRWKAFGHLDIQVDDPPRWHTDYLFGRDLATSASAFNLDHRELPGGADIKLIWELSRWNQLVRLAMAAYVLNDERAGRKCIEWLEDWVKHNPPYRGWNWTSALEAGMRLIQFTWIDALLSESAAQPAGDNSQTRLSALREQILAPHARFIWRHKSFGSSANNHLIGELAGLIVATARWPELQRWAAPLETLQFLWQREVLTQFAEDGGNKEQALNYHLFSWEFCWQARLAISSAGRNVPGTVEARLGAAAQFFWEVQARCEPWDYGDSDNGIVVPLFARDQTALHEWQDWFGDSTTGLGTALSYWQGQPPGYGQLVTRGEPLHTKQGNQWRMRENDWWLYEASGITICEQGHWWLRWDLSPLGYLRTAAHGHLDALHLSMWFKGVAMVIDPGTGAYFADSHLRNWLASRAAHNTPCPTALDFPARAGPFLWSEHHAIPSWEPAGRGDAEPKNHGSAAALKTPSGVIKRAVLRHATGDGWSVEDSYEVGQGTCGDFTVHWQFAPGSWVKRIGERTFSVHRQDVSVTVQADESWDDVELEEDAGLVDFSELRTFRSLEGIVSPAFRRLCRAPFLKLTARAGDKPCVFRTTFLASPHS